MKKKVESLFTGFYSFLSTLVKRRSLIFEMAKREISTQYAGSLLGFFWTFINPLIMIFILWLVFGLGFRTKPRGDVPFLVWLTAGLATWNAFSEIINGLVGSIVSNSHLVKKMRFPLSILPVVKLVSSFITHGIFLLLLIVLILLYRMPVSIYWLQILYYSLSMCILALGLSWIVSSVNVFVRDTSQIVRVMLMFGFWITPIFWDLNIMPAKLQYILRLNPMFYIIQGYRDSFIYFVPFWAHWRMTFYFWAETGIIFILGAIIFLRLRPHFADVV